VHCETHSYHTRHKSDTYILHSKTLKDALLSRLPDLHVLINVVPPSLQDRFYSPEDPKWMGLKPVGRYRFPRVGAFEVVIKGKTVFSKLESGRWPPHGRVVDWVKQVLDGLEPDTHPLRPQTREVKSRGGKRYTASTEKASTGALKASASQDSFPAQQPRKRTPSPLSSPKEQRETDSRKREEYMSPAKPNIAGKGSSHDQFSPQGELSQMPGKPRTPPALEDRSKDMSVPQSTSPVHTDPIPPVLSPAINLPSSPPVNPAPADDYMDDFPPAEVQPQSNPHDKDPAPAGAREEDDDLDALVPETDFTDEMNLEIPIGHTSSQSLQQENASELPQKVTLRSSNPAVLVLAETAYTVPPGQTIDMRLDIAASDSPGVKQCVLYIAVDGKVTDCILLNINYRSAEEMAEEDEDQPEAFAFNIPLNKKVKKVGE